MLLPSRGIHRVLDSDEAQRTQRSDVLNQPRQVLNAGSPDAVSQGDHRRSDEWKRDTLERDFVPAVDVKELVAPSEASHSPMAGGSPAAQVREPLRRRGVAGRRNDMHISPEALKRRTSGTGSFRRR